MAFNGLTKKGQEYLATKLASNLPIEFLKVKIGNGDLLKTQNPEELEDLINFKKEAGILEKSQTENLFKMKISLDNNDVNTAFYINEIGVYVKDGEQEILYWYFYEENASYLPDKNSPVSYKYTLNMQVTNNVSNVINWDGKDLFVDKEFIEKELQVKEDKFAKKTGFNLDKLDDLDELESLEDEEKDISLLVASGKALKKVWDKTLEVLGLVNDNKSAILNNEENISNSYFSRNSYDDLNILSFLIVENDNILDTVYSSSRLEKGYLVIDIAVNTLTTIKGHNIIATIDLTGTDLKTNSFQVGVSASDKDTRIREQLGIPGMLFDIAVLSDKIYKINIWKYSTATPNERSYATIKLPVYKY